MKLSTLSAAGCSWLFSTASDGMSAEDIWSTWWLVIRLSPNVEPSELLMAVITFWFTTLWVDPCCYWRAWNSRLVLTSIFCWKDRAGVESTFTRGFGHVSEVAFTMCGNPNKVFSIDNSAQLTFRFPWPAWH